MSVASRTTSPQFGFRVTRRTLSGDVIITDLSGSLTGDEMEELFTMR